MELILMRHAIAEQRSSRYPDDALRPLAKEGEKKHAAVARAMRRMGITFDVILSSPLVRARQTAEITAREYEWEGDLVEVDALGSGFSFEALSSFLRRYQDERAVLCVGHEPDFSTYAARLLHASGDVEIDFKKSGVLGVEVAGAPRPGGGTLLYFLKPGHCARIAERA